MVGFVGVSRVNPSGPSGRSASHLAAISGSSPASDIDFRSAPAQKASSPAPVSTMTRASSSASKLR